MLHGQAAILKRERPQSFRASSGSLFESGTSIFQPIVDGRYEARLASNAKETVSALRLRHSVFNIEMGIELPDGNISGLEFDAYDFRCRHIIVMDRATGETVGTYRLNSMETASSVGGFYSAGEFSLEDLPFEVLDQGVEIGRACIAKSHRNTKVLYLLFKALMAYLTATKKRYFFGCCSIFATDIEAGLNAYNQLTLDGYLHDRYRVRPRNNGKSSSEIECGAKVELPSLFKLYLKLGARVCGPPAIDREFGSIDFFVVFDVSDLQPKYRRSLLPADFDRPC